MEDTPEFRLASLQRKLHLLSEVRQATVTSIYASCYRSEVFDGRRVGAAFDTFGESGSLYVTTHPEQSLVRIDPLGKRTTIAGPDQGMVGSTACAFGTAPDDQTCAE